MGLLKVPLDDQEVFVFQTNAALNPPFSRVLFSCDARDLPALVRLGARL